MQDMEEPKENLDLESIQTTELDDRHGQELIETIESDEPSPVRSRKSRTRGRIRDLLVSVVLFALGIFALGFAWSLYPIENIPNRPDRVTVGLDGAISEITDVTLSAAVLPKHDRAYFSVTLQTDTAPTEAVGVAVVLPQAGNYLDELSKELQCSIECDIDEPFSGTNDVNIGFVLEPNDWTVGEESGAYFSTISLTLPQGTIGIKAGSKTDTFGIRCTELACRASLPTVTAVEGRLDPNKVAVVQTFMGEEYFSYDWDAQVPPRKIEIPGNSSATGFVLNFVGKLDYVSRSSLTSVIHANGTDETVAKKVEFRTFLSGALVGLAGALFLAAFQEGLAARRRFDAQTTTTDEA